MAVLRDRPYVQFNFLVDLGDGHTEGAAGRLPGDERHRHGGDRRRVPQRQRAGEQRPEDHRHEQVDRRDDEARRDRLAEPLQVARPDPQRRPERVPDGHDPAPERGPHRRSCRPGSCSAPGSSSTSAGRSTPRAPTWRWRSWRSPTSGWRWSRPCVASPARAPAGDPRSSRQPPPPDDVLPRMDVAAFVGFAERGPLDTPVAVEDLARLHATCSAATSRWRRDPERGERGDRPPPRRRWRRSSATAAGAAGWCGSPARARQRPRSRSRGCCGSARRHAGAGGRRGARPRSRRAPPGAGPDDTSRAPRSTRSTSGRRRRRSCRGSRHDDQAPDADSPVATCASRWPGRPT